MAYIKLKKHPMKKRYLFNGLYILSLFLCVASQGQSYQPQLPNLTPQSPEAAAMSKYGEYPVSMYTGIPDISIPLYEIKSGKFTVPITLSYHASGNKVNDMAPWVGLGWSLNAGGSVSRKVMGKDDQSYPRNVRDANSINPENDNDHLYLQSVYNGTTTYDTDPDIYNYNFPGKSGRFIFKDSITPVMIPYSGVKVAGFQTPNKLTDENGNNYFFDYTDHQNTLYPSKGAQVDPISSWLLTKMADAGNTDSIKFTYQSIGIGTLGLDYVDYITVDDSVDDGTCVHTYTSGVSPSAMSYSILTYGDEVVPSRINFTEGIVKFIPSTTNRLDRPYIDCFHNCGFKSMDRIEIYSKEDTTTPIKTILFYESYFINSSETDTSGNKRLKLDSLRILDKNSHVIQRYKFDYNTTLQLPAYSSKSKDYWGYYNHQYNDMLVPRMSIHFVGDNYSSSTYVNIGSGNIVGRDPDPNFNQAYILNRITYPTGGYTTFEYETNKYLDGQNNSTYAGGLRISQILSYNENGVCSKKTYKYGENESGYGRFNVFLSDFSFSQPAVSFQYVGACKPGCCNTTDTKRSRTYSSNPCTDLNPFDGSPVVYSTVTEYIGDKNTNSGKTIYQYTDDPDVRQNYFASSVDKSFKINKSFRRALLDTKTVYKIENASYKKISYLKNYYYNYSTQSVNLALRVVQVMQYEGTVWPSDRYEYAWCNVPIFWGDNLLTISNEYTYDMNDTTKYVFKSTYYNYNDPLYTQVSSKITTTSTQDTLTTLIKYPTDFLNNSLYEEMADTTNHRRNSRNIIAAPVQEYQIMNRTDTLYGKRTNYHKYFQNLFVPKSVDFKTGTNPWETRIFYSSYDQSGNLISAKKDKDIPISYIYNAYNQPIAEVANADTNTFYFNDFENSDGNSNLDDCKTGRKSRTGGFSKALTGLQSGTYILSWWSKSSGVWTFNSTNVAISGSYTISLTGQVDDVRFYINNSTMKTYTYDPLIGITSMTDQNNITTYYEYDSFSRLKYIKDQNKNILKAYDYHYKSKAINP